MSKAIDAAAHGGTLKTENSDAAWHDRKKWAWMLGLTVPTIPFGTWVLHELTNSPLAWWYGPIVIFFVFPVVDTLAGLDGANPPDSLLEALEEQKYYRYITYLFLPIQYISLVWACWMWAYGDLSTFESVGLAWTVAMVSGIAIAVAHELGHKKPKLERWLAKIALAETFYGHFFIEHNRGHHVRVSTPEDPASARMGENVFRFIPRTVWGSLASAWHLESARFERMGKSKWSLKNDLINAWLMSVVLYGGLTAIFGVEILPYLLLQGVVGFCMLEVVNYIEHYGLLRQKKEDGRYERCLPSHSWNSNNQWSNVFLYHLQRHSDHHANPTRRYQALLHVDEAPQLPSGYATMMALAMIPPVWNRIMDKRILQHYEGDVTKANILPGKRAKVMKKYGPGTAAAEAAIAAGKYTKPWGKERQTVEAAA
ncbi:MAG: alkane 1-monooxygenase [Actinobacteria bacterium]|nr:alkane 1-monooxygenase [Actinomycetota bacterium]